MHDYADVFFRSEFDLGRTEALPHRIDTGDSRPIKQPLRRHPKIHEDFIDEQVQKMLAANVIELCASPWASNVVLAKKSDGTLRFCMDYRRLNDCTFCSVLFLSLSRSEGWPHHGRTFSIYFLHFHIRKSTLFLYPASMVT